MLLLASHIEETLLPSHELVLKNYPQTTPLNNPSHLIFNKLPKNTNLVII